MEVDICLDGQMFHVQLKEKDGSWTAVVDGEEFPIRLDRRGPGSVVCAGDRAFVVQPATVDTVIVDGQELAMRLEHLHGVAGVTDGAGLAGAVKPPMTGRLDDVRVTVGQRVERGDVLFVLEAMKMRNEVKSPAAGVVAEVHVQPGVNVDPKMTIVTLSSE